MRQKAPGLVMQSVDRALAILLVLAQGPASGLPLAEISRALGLNQSTCHHLLSTLKARRFVEQDPASRRYRLGIKAVEVGQAAVQQVDLARVALPRMEELMRAAQENVNLVILEEDSAVYVAQVPCDRTVRMFTRIGERAPLHCTGVGKVLLAYLPEEERAALLARTGLPRFTPNTICDPAALDEELKKVKAQGYALDHEEREQDVACLAAPVRDYRGQVVAALSISAPASRLGPERRAELLPRLLETAAAIARDLGWTGE